ncbi:MAG: hypothetical protein ABI843_13170 [Dokdonella sp.]
MRTSIAALAGLLGMCFAAASASAAGRASDSEAGLDHASAEVASRACTALVQRVDAVAGAEPVWLLSYDPAKGTDAPDAPALRTAAFTYDNALAVIALLACKHPMQASRVGRALELAIAQDTRLRNVYRAGPVADKVLPNGWWDAAANRWVEDAYQQGTSSGNVAWAALALLALHDASGETHWSDTAATLARWVVTNTRSEHGGGFSGGIDGFDAAPVALGWKSTEHAIDLVALFARLAQLAPSAGWQDDERHARRFLDHQWDASSGHFLIGTMADGTTPNPTTSALDVQWWSQLLPDAPSDWRRAIAYAEAHHAVGAGFDFNDDRDGEWLEGTAQGALAYRIAGRDDAASRCLREIARQFSAGGYVFATREARITTGLAIGSASTSADFYYYRRPHLGATAWAILAARAWNPYIGKR